jgi:hypothetical protein
VSELEAKLANLLVLADLSSESAPELISRLRQIYHGIHDIDLSRYDADELRSRVPALLATTFAARMRVRDRIAEWKAGMLLNRETVWALRDLFRIARYGADMLGEVGIMNERLAPGETSKRGFTGSDYNTLVHPKFDNGRNIAFQSGDVLLMRGSAHNSAAIARIGDVDTQFSHIAIIYIDDEGKHWVVEALIEDGSVINTLEHVLDHGLGRAVLYRHKDAALAARAAKMVNSRVLATKTGAAPHIPYDFTMRLKGRKTLFCAKLVQQAFLDASAGKTKLPEFRTRLDRKHNRAFFKSIGVKARETFAPGDIDLDTAFDLVAEWQDYRVTPRLRRQDMIMTKMFEWMETRGYEFKEDFFIKLVAVFGQLSSHLSDRSKNLIANVVPKVPRNMTRSCIAVIAMLHKTAETLMPELTALDDDHVTMTGTPLHPIEILNHLEKLRDVSGGKIGYLHGKA